MQFQTIGLTCLLLLSGISPVQAAEPKAAETFRGLDLTRDWPWWRGPTHDGIAAPGQDPPLTWSDSQNLAWSVPVTGRSHGSPTVVGDQVVLAVADPEKQIQAVQSFDRLTGKMQWSKEIHNGGFDQKENKKSSLASISVAGDGERFYVSFLHAGAVYATCLTREGQQLWQKKVCDFINHQGYGASPFLYRALVIVAADNKGGGAIEAFDRRTGESVWRIERPKLPNYTSPVVYQIAGRDQLLFTGCDVVSSFDPLTGKTLWETAGATTECVTSVVTDGERVFTSGGYPKNHVSAVLADGSGKLVWEAKSRVYVPSMIVRGKHLYGIQDAGVATCWKSDTGEEVWKERIAGGFSSSPVLVGDLLMATNEVGHTYVFKASDKEFLLIGENQLGDETFSTPTVCGSRIYHRYAKLIDGKRQEFLACIAKPGSGK